MRGSNICILSVVHSACCEWHVSSACCELMVCRLVEGLELIHGNVLAILVYQLTGLHLCVCGGGGKGGDNHDCSYL